MFSVLHNIVILLLYWDIMQINKSQEQEKRAIDSFLRCCIMHVQEIHLLCWLTNNVLNTNVMRVENIFSLNKAFFALVTHMLKGFQGVMTQICCVHLLYRADDMSVFPRFFASCFREQRRLDRLRFLELSSIKPFKIRNCLLCPRIFFINWDRQGHSLPKLYVYMYMYFCIPMYDNVWCQSCVHINVDACCV